MTKEFKLPEIGENVESGDVTNIVVSVGDMVKKDDPVIEVETDKASIEVPSEVEGKVVEIKAVVGEKINVGEVVIVVETEGGEAAPAKEAPKAEEAPKEEPKQEEVKEEPAEAPAQPSAAGGLQEFKLPELGENIDAADVTAVNVSVGDTIKLNDPVLEIETDKASVEVPSEVEGVVKEVKIAVGDKAKVGQVIIVVEGGSSAKAAPAPKQEAAKTEAAPAKQEAPKQQQAADPKPVDTKVAKAKISGGKIAPASPSVRRFAREIGIDINQVSGSGPRHRISIDDVKKHAKRINEQLSQGVSSSGAPVIGVAKEPLPDFTKWGDVELKPMSNVRKKTAEHLSYAWSTIPHVTQFDKADITELEKLRKKFQPLAEKAGGKLTVTAILLKIIASAMKVYPEFNSSIDMDNKQIIYKNYYNIGIAVDTDRGLLVPVIKDVDKKNIVELAAELAEISVKARNKKLTLDDMQGGNFSISNLGGIGGTSFTPIVNSPEVAILGISRGKYEPVWIDGEFKPRLMLPLSLSYDHRIIDGADGARFIRWIVEALENPFLLSLEG